MQNTAKDFKALESIGEADDLLFDSLVMLLGSLIDSCEALQAYVEASMTSEHIRHSSNIYQSNSHVERTIHAQYDDTFQESGGKLKEYNEQVQKRIVIYLAMKRSKYSFAYSYNLAHLTGQSAMTN